MSHRFFANEPITKSAHLLEGDQAHHLINVMRFDVGDEVTLFDGTGQEFVAKIKTLEKKRVFLDIVEIKQSTLESRIKLTIAVALPKGDRQKFMIEKLVELGVDALIPLKTQRSVAEPNPKVLVRLNRQVVEASKQCGRNHLLAIKPASTLKELLEQAKAPSVIRLLADPYTTESANDALNRLSPVSSEGPAQTLATVIAIGPEGGFTPEESTTLTSADWSPVLLGRHVLRIETAAIAAAAILCD